MKALKFLASAVAAGLIFGLGLVAMSPYESAPAVARALPPPGKPLPDLTGQSLGDAEALLDDRGIDHDTAGSGLLDILPELWTVCETEPAGPATVQDGEQVTLYVDYSC